MQLFRLARTAFSFSSFYRPHTTQVFAKMTNKQLATPQLVKKTLLKRIPFHSRLSQYSLYHGKRVRHAIQSCFSQKKSKRFKRVRKLKQWVHSDILGVKVFVRMTNKASRCIRKAGSFDNYILVTPPKQLDSKMGEYYRQLMLRKINDPSYRVPYVIGSGKVDRIRKYQKYQWTQKARKLPIPKQFKEKLQTYQKKFGSRVEQFDQQDYQKYLQVQKLRKLWGKQVDHSHPLLIQIEGKLQQKISDEEMDILQKKSEQFKDAYLNNPRNREYRLQNFEYNQREMEKDNARIREAWIKHQAIDDADRE